LFLLVVTLSLHPVSFSQESEKNTTEGGFTIGPMVFLGDLGGHFGKGTGFLKDYNMATTKLSIGAFVTAFPAQWLGFRFSLNYGRIEGDDGLIKGKGGDEETRLARNLNFRSTIWEGTVMAEFYPTVFLEDDPEDVTARLRPYGVLGLGLFHFNPQASYNDPNGTQYWVDLKPLHTEGEGFAEYPTRKNYSLMQMNIPMGAGIKYFFSENLNVSFEIIHRKTFIERFTESFFGMTNFVHIHYFQAVPFSFRDFLGIHLFRTGIAWANHFNVEPLCLFLAVSH